MNDRLASKQEARRRIERWYRDGLAAVDPRAAVECALSWNGRSLNINDQHVDVSDGGRIAAVAIGKAASQMAHGLAGVMGERLESGIILTKDGHTGQPPAGWEAFEAAHPVPDERGTAATRHIIENVSTLEQADVAIVLISGGGSALLESPRDPLDLRDIQETTRLLLMAGAPIQDLNAVRSELSDVKGGGLRRLIGDATCVTLILSDVLGNDPGVIASGPTISREPRPDRALELLESYGIAERVPPRVVALLRNGTPDASAQASRDVFTVIGDNEAFIGRIAGAARADGHQPVVGMSRAEGEASLLAMRFLEVVAAQPDDVDVVIGGGEATVIVTGDGRGGRNTEFALAAAIRLSEERWPWVIASLASDGEDGAIAAAGAVVDRETISRGQAAGLDASAFLANNDSGGYFERLGDLLVPGPTGTNVNDVYIAVRTLDGCA